MPAGPSKLADLPVEALRAVKNALNQEHFHLILSPTERCNFRCRYCYEDFAVGKMSSNTEARVKNFLAKKVPSLGSLQLSWFGGEPLLAKKQVLSITAFAHAICQANGVNLSGDMATNGWLLSTETVSQFSQVGLTDYQVTLDGADEHHDRTRVDAKGAGTFQRIWANLLALHQSPLEFRVRLRLHVYVGNEPGLVELAAKIRGALGSDSRFGVDFHPILNYGGYGANAVGYLTKEDYWSAVERLKLAFGPRLLEEARLSDKYGICYAAKPNSLFIRPNGRIGKCTVALNEPYNDLGTLEPDGTPQLSSQKLRAWTDALRVPDFQRLRCPKASVAANAEAPLAFRSRS